MPFGSTPRRTRGSNASESPTAGAGAAGVTAAVDATGVVGAGCCARDGAHAASATAAKANRADGRRMDTELHLGRGATGATWEGERAPGRTGSLVGRRRTALQYIATDVPQPKVSGYFGLPAHGGARGVLHRDRP